MFYFFVHNMWFNVIPISHERNAFMHHCDCLLFDVQTINTRNEIAHNSKTVNELLWPETLWWWRCVILCSRHERMLNHCIREKNKNWIKIARGVKIKGNFHWNDISCIHIYFPVNYSNAKMNHLKWYRQAFLVEN